MSLNDNAASNPSPALRADGPSNEMGSRLIRVVAADEQPLLLEGIASVFGAAGDIALVGRAASGPEALAAIRKLDPDIAVLSQTLLGKDGIELLEALRGSGTRARPVLLTERMTQQEFTQALQLGVRGVFFKFMPVSLLVLCVRRVDAGREFYEQNLLLETFGKLWNRVVAPAQAADALTEREIAVLEFVARGFRNKEIGRKLGISEGTVKVHLHRVSAKLRVTGRMMLVDRAREMGLL